MKKAFTLIELKAFTLIELLIVVAIIAILAAIAVPNFLEAQIRSKVSRCKADMSSMRTAILAYQVDWNQVPPSEPKPGSSLGTTILPHLTVLTTPIAYISSVPPDPFDSSGLTGDAGYFQSRGCYWYYRFLPKFDYGPAQGAVDRTLARGITWVLASVGPSRQLVSSSSNANYIIIWNILGGSSPSSPQYLYIYDPTNGSISRGHLMITNKGWVDGNMIR